MGDLLPKMAANGSVVGIRYGHLASLHLIVYLTRTPLHKPRPARATAHIGRECPAGGLAGCPTALNRARAGVPALWAARRAR